MDQLIRETRDVCDRLIVAVGTLSCKGRGEVSSRAKWLLNAVRKLEAELAGEPPPADPGLDEADHAEVEARIAEARERKP